MSYYCTMEQLEVKTYPDGSAFAAHCLGFLNEKEIENNVVISTAPKLKEDCLLFSVRDKIEDKILLCGMKDSTFNVLEIVCYEEDPTKLKNILDSTAAFLLTHPLTPTIIAVSARKDISAYFKDFLNTNFNTRLHEELPLRCYICKKITDYALDKIKKVPGKLVIADDTHLDACLQLRLDFEDFVTPPTQRLSTEFWRSHTIDLIKTKRVWLWFDDGKFTSLTMSMRETPNSIAVNTVFTPEEYRGRGYATALVASVTQLLLQMKPNVFLFADLNNPISNKVYMNIGFEGVEDSFCDNSKNEHYKSRLIRLIACYGTMERLEVKTYPDGAAFAADCLGFLNEKEIENNVMVSIAPKLKEDCLLLSVRDKIEDKILLCGMKDSTFNILAIVCYEEDPTKLKNILDSTAAFLLTHPLTPTMISVSARKDISGYFKDFLNTNFNAGLHEEMLLRCYICKKVTDYALDKINKVPGKLVTADDTHLETCLQLMLDFEAFIHPPKQRRSEEFMRSRLADLIKTKWVWLWVDDGKFTSLTMSTRETTNSIGVNAVFTPEEYRGRGYATALVASVVQLLLQIKPNVFLFADLDNPISNKVYMNIGFEGVEDSVRWDC